jgi:uncharacterized protein (TIGR03067 family)
MTLIRLTAVGLAIALFGLVAWAGGSGDFKAMQGEWAVRITEQDGKPATPDVAKLKFVIVIKDNTFRMLLDEKVLSAGTFKIDPSKKPATIDTMTTEGPTKGAVQYGIYKINGDKVTAVFAKADKDRPTEFKTTEGSGHSIVEYTRMKKN